MITTGKVNGIFTIRHRNKKAWLISKKDGGSEAILITGVVRPPPIPVRRAGQTRIVSIAKSRHRKRRQKKGKFLLKACMNVYHSLLNRSRFPMTLSNRPYLISVRYI